MAQLKVQGNASGTGVFTVTSPNSNNTQTLTLPDATATLVGDTATQTLTNKTLGSGLVAGASIITSGTAVASTSGTAIDFTSIPSWVKRITVMFNGVSTNGTSNYRVQLGTGGTPTTSGYTGSSSWTGTSSTTLTLASGFDINSNTSATSTFAGLIVFANVSGNIWVASGVTGYTAGTSSTQQITGVVTLSGVLNMVRVTTANGTDTFDAGSINILYE